MGREEGKDEGWERRGRSGMRGRRKNEKRDGKEEEGVKE